MRAFIASCAAAIVIAVVAFFVLDSLGLSSSSVFSSGNVRL